jgi:hypothetical protein
MPHEDDAPVGCVPDTATATCDLAHLEFEEFARADTFAASLSCAADDTSRTAAGLSACLVSVIAVIPVIPVIPVIAEGADASHEANTR